MSCIRRAKPKVVTLAAIATAILIVTLSGTSTEVIAAERIPDCELASLYGGHLYYDPYCATGGSNCPANTDCENMNKCRFCTARTGKYCKDAYSSDKDDDTCADGTSSCPNRLGPPDEFGVALQIVGYCVMVDCIAEPWVSGEWWPPCSDHVYSTCDDHAE